MNEVAFTYRPPSRTLNAKWDRFTGELTLEENGRCLAATKDTRAFEAAARLLGEGTLVVFDGWIPRVEWP